jgi:peptidoglycan hydrolase CwlO-like protein
MKHISAILTAIVITAVIGLGIFVIGVNALTNTNTVPLQNSPGSASSATTSNTAVTGASSTSNDVQQLQQQVTSLQSQLDQATQVLQQYQSLIQILQQRGVIVIDQNGNIFLPQGSSNELH